MNARGRERIAVAGAGSWGTALAAMLGATGHDVTLWARRPAHARELARARENARYLPGVRLTDGVRVSARVGDAAGAGILVMAVPTHAMRGTLRRFADVARAADVVVNTAKGLEEGTRLRMSEVLAEEVEGTAVASLLGPSHAEEVGRGMPTSVVVASTDAEAAVRVQRALSGRTFRVYTNDDVVGVELATALKNVIAIAAGILDGLGYGDNTRAALVTRGLAEMTRLGTALGARATTFAGLAGVGDLVVTCLSRHSRNRRLGEAVGRGAALDEAVAALGMVAEGVRTTRVALELAADAGVEMPIAQTVHAVLFEGVDPREGIEALMQRPLRDETP